MPSPKLKIGRPLAKIETTADPVAVAAMAGVGATDGEIGDYYGLSAEDVAERYATELAQARAARALRLRQAEHRAATAGDGRALGAAVRSVKMEQERRESAARVARRWRLPAERKP